MQILGSPVSLFQSIVSESPWERTLPVAPPPAVRTDAKALSERPVTRTERTEGTQYRRPHSAPVRVMAGDSYARRALAAYESTQRLEWRDDLRSFTGIDAYA
ncbi:MAG: hypothetical protein ACUVQI_02195 [Thermochromatium sp.]